HIHERKWFEKLDEWQKKLIKQNVDLILTETRVLPTQLRTFPLVGMRNAYETINGILEDQAIVTDHYFHSGTLAALSPYPSENSRIGLLHGEQLKVFTKAKTVITLTLNSKINPSGNDGAIVSDTQEISDKMGFFHSNLPLNKARIVSIND